MNNNAHSIQVGRWSVILSAGVWWVTITWLPVEIDDVLDGWVDDEKSGKSRVKSIDETKKSN